jgi:hypothetical protein
LIKKTLHEVKINALEEQIKLNYSKCGCEYGEYKVNKKYGFKYIEHEI